MIISISGKAGSGKDEVGKIIQEFLPEFEIKKWATKVKEIVSLLIGCSMEDLENREFKSTPLPMFENKLTPRELLQLMGTECGREIIHEDIWVTALMREYKGFNLEAADESLTVKGMYFHTSCDNCEKSFTGYKRQFLCKDCTDKLNPIMPNWIITDSRFANEIKAVEDRGGITIRVNRNPEWKWIDKQEWDLHTKGIVPHESETALDDATFDYVIDNNSDIEDLKEKVRKILKDEKII